MTEDVPHTKVATAAELKDKALVERKLERFATACVFHGIGHCVRLRARCRNQG